MRKTNRRQTVNAKHRAYASFLCGLSTCPLRFVLAAYS